MRVIYRHENQGLWTVEDACAVHGADCDALLAKINAHLADKA